MTAPSLISGLSEIAPGYDALICDVWGVVHDGSRAHPAAAEALKNFRENHGPVVLLTNAPRLAEEVAAQCAQYGVPEGCYDAIVSSGAAARAELEKRGADGLPLYYIGPDKDLPLLAGLGLNFTGIEAAELVFCTGLVDDLTETPADYADRLAKMRARNLTMLCANPDLVVHRGAQLCFCAGALARDYEKLGGTAVYYGKPHLPIYDVALAAASRAATAAGRPLPKKPLAVGDGLFTDIAGANRAGLDVLFIGDGVHGEEVEPFTADHLAKLFAKSGVTVTASSRRLQW